MPASCIPRHNSLTSPVSLSAPASPGLAFWLWERVIALALSTCRAPRLPLLGVDEQPEPSPTIHGRLFDRPLAPFAAGDRRTVPWLRLPKRHLAVQLSGSGCSRSSQAPPPQTTTHQQAPPAAGQRATTGQQAAALVTDLQEAAITSQPTAAVATRRQETPANSHQEAMPQSTSQPLQQQQPATQPPPPETPLSAPP
jgi:hypothetical protein